MNRIAYWLLIALFSLAATGCAKGGSEPEIDVTEARGLLEQYMEARVARDLPTMQNLVVPELRDSLVGEGTSAPYLFQYGIGAPSALERGISFPTVQFQRYDGNLAWSHVEVTTYVVVRRDGSVLVDTANRLGSEERAGSVEARLNKSQPPQLHILRDRETHTTLTMEELPSMVSPYGTDVQFGPGKEGFSAVSFSPDLNTVAFATLGTHSLLALMTIGTKEVKSLDLIYGGGVAELVFSIDGKWLGVAVNRPSGGMDLQLWDSVLGTKQVFSGLPEHQPNHLYGHLFWRGERLLFTFQGEDWELEPVTGEAKKR